MKNHKILDWIIIGLTIINLSTLTSITASANHLHAANWEHNKAGAIYVAPVNKQNEITYWYNPHDQNKKAIRTAIDNWNHLDVIKLIASTHHHSYLTIKSDGKKLKPALNGVAVNNYIISKHSPIIMTKTHIYLNPVAFKKSHNEKFKVTVVMHEIGHALGFAHDNQLKYNPKYKQKLPFVMNKILNDNQKSYPHLGELEKKALLKHYPIHPHANQTVSSTN